MKKTALAAIALASGLAFASAAVAQHNHPTPAAAPAAATAAAAPAPAAAPQARPSPMAIARISLGDTYVRVVYSRPAKKGRDNIFGTKDAKALVPYGEVWRTGANEATEITVTKNVAIGGKTLPAGTYSVFTVPGPDNWAIHFNSALGLWGSNGYDAAKDVLVLTAKATPLTDEVEQFTIDLPKTDSGADLVLKWIKTEVRVPVKAAA